MNGNDEEFINFKKPQNEMFRKLDGKIQQLVAAHSNLNKLYALHEFSATGLGPKKPFELPPQLPPPPPCIPKQLAGTTRNEHGVLDNVKNLDFPLINSEHGLNKIKLLNNEQSTNLIVDPTVSRLHQKVQHDWQTPKMNENSKQFVQAMPPNPAHRGLRGLSQQPIKVSELSQKIKETFEAVNAKAMQDMTHKKRNISTFETAKMVADIRDKILNLGRLAQEVDLERQAGSLRQQSLIANVKKETSLLLNKQRFQLRYGSSLLPTQQNLNCITKDTQINRIMKIVVPPSEFISDSIINQSARTRNLKPVEAIAKQKNDLSYSLLKSKIRKFQDTYSPNSEVPFLRGRRKKGHKKIDSIVQRLTNRVVSSEESPTITLKPTKPSPIPVFASPSQTCNKASYVYAHGGGNVAKLGLFKSKTASTRYQTTSLKLVNHLDKEIPSPSIEQITVEQFAKYLNLVRANDASLQKKKQQLLQSELNWKLPIGNRPLRLRRIHKGERMPASASYRASRMVGLD